MRVLTISNCHPIESQGSGYIIANYTKKLRDRGHQVALFGPTSYEPLAWVKIGKRHRQALGMLFLSVYQTIFRTYDVIEFYGGEACLAITLLKRWPRRRFLIALHSCGLETHYAEVLINWRGTDSLDGKPRRWFQRLLRLPFDQAFRNADCMVVVSDFDKAYSLRKGYQRQDTLLAVNNPLPDCARNLQVEWEREPNIGFCGSWLENKGSRILPEAIHQILTANPKARFWLIGVGDVNKRSISTPEIADRIEIIPHVADKRELIELYKTLSILIMPSIYESFGLVSTEAMACGCALVATKTGFAASLENHREAVLLDEPTSDCIERAVNLLLNNDKLRRSIAQRGYDRVQTLRWEEAITTLEESYKSWHSKRS